MFKKIIMIILLIVISLSLIYILPSFVKFMETQDDLFQIKANEQIIEEENIEDIENINEITIENEIISEPNVEIQNAEPETDNWIKFTATAYCACEQCCGKTDGITASGAKATAGITVAMPSSYSFGTKILLKDVNGILLNNGETYIVQDRGGAIGNNRIDIYFDTHQEALNFGRRTVYLKVVD